MCPLYLECCKFVFETNDFNGHQDKGIDNYDSDDEEMINGVPGGNSWKLWNNFGAPLAFRCCTPFHYLLIISN